MTQARGVEGGFSLIEVTVSFAILAVALLGLVSAMALAAKRSALTAETAIAQDAARKKLEEIESQDFRFLYELYNTSSSDDPGGSGTAPGATFTVLGLRPRQGQTTCGRVVFPTATGGAGNYSFAESQTIAELGMPMDLSGDGDTNDSVKTSQIVRCPAKVRVEWRGATGNAELEVCALIIRR